MHTDTQGGTETKTPHQPAGQCHGLCLATETGSKESLGRPLSLVRMEARALGPLQVAGSLGSVRYINGMKVNILLIVSYHFAVILLNDFLCVHIYAVIYYIYMQ